MKNLFRALLFLLAFSTIVHPQETTPYFGIQTHFGQISVSNIDTGLVISILDSIKKAGVKCIRDEMYWSIVESTPGVFNFPAGFDFYVDQARARGITVLLILDYNNPLYAAHAGAGITTDTNRALFLRYCKAVLARYLPKGIKNYEIWNEPNIPTFWDPAPSAAEYAKLLRKVYPALKSVDSSITILGCATSPAEGNPSPFIEWKQYIATAFQQGAGEFLDGVSFHLYRVDKNPEMFLDTDISALQAIIGANKKLFITECGYHTSTAWPALNTLKQAEYVARLYLIGKKHTMLKQISYYDFRNDGENAAEPEHNFGIVYNNLAPKPAYGYLRSLTSEIGGKNFISSTTTENYYKYTFSDTSEKTYAMWSTAAVVEKAELFGSNMLRKRLSTGELSYHYSSDRIIYVPYSTSPLYYTELKNFPPINSIKIKVLSDTLIAGQSVQLNVQGIMNDGTLLTADSKAAAWVSLDTTAVINANGVLKALKPGPCRIKMNLLGFEEIHTFNILNPYDVLEIAAFNSLTAFSVSYQQMLPQTSVQIIDTNYSSSPSSLLLSYTFKYAGIDKHRAFFDYSNLPLPGEPDSLFLDVYNNGNPHIIGFTVTDADGQDFSINTPFSGLSGSYGWKTVKVTLRNFGSSFNYPVKLKRITAYCVKSGGLVDSVYSGRILLDNLRIHNGILSSVGQGNTTPYKDFFLYQNYPNPFNPKTTIFYELAETAHLRLSVSDILGREICVLHEGLKPAGKHRLSFDGSNLTSGLYFCVLQAGNHKTAKKMLLLK